MKDTKNIVVFALWGIGCIAMIVMGVYAFFKTGAVSSAISSILGAAALITGIITFCIRLNERKNGSVLKLDWVLWFLLALLLFKTSLFSAIGGILFFIIGILLILTAVSSVRAALSDGVKISGLIYGILLGLLGIYLFFHSRSVFDSVISKVVGVYLVVHGIYLANDLLGRIRYSRNFKGVE
ncbi:MAG: DUF308 domain-containing protein [Oscillospiraceae bacterium]|nr:DUF308 domain-containing protein [Oscillospiraceae bacterium]